MKVKIKKSVVPHTSSEYDFSRIWSAIHTVSGRHWYRGVIRLHSTPSIKEYLSGGFYAWEVL